MLYFTIDGFNQTFWYVFPILTHWYETHDTVHTRWTRVGTGHTNSGLSDKTTSCFNSIGFGNIPGRGWIRIQIGPIACRIKNSKLEAQALTLIIAAVAAQLNLVANSQTTVTRAGNDLVVGIEQGNAFADNL